MDLQSNISFLTDHIQRQRTAAKWYLILAIAIFGVGILVAIVSAMTQTDDKSNWIVTLGGSFISTLSGFPIKEIVANRNKEAALGFLQMEFKRLDGKEDAESAALMDELDKRFWEIIDKNL